MEKRYVLHHIMRKIRKSIVTLYPFNLFKFADMKKENHTISHDLFLFVLLFVLQKPIFMVYYHDLYTNVSLGDYFRVMWHGLPLDLSLAGYLTAIPGILLIASAWTNSSILRRIRQGYFGSNRLCHGLLFIIDLGLYGFWGFRLDATPFSISSLPQRCYGKRQLLVCTIGNLIYVDLCSNFILYFLLRPYPGEKPLKIPYRRQNVSLALLLLTAALFIPIRGGFSVSTMNLSKGIFQSGPTHESCSHQSGIQLHVFRHPPE